MSTLLNQLNPVSCENNSTDLSLSTALTKATEQIQSHQHPDGYWHYTLEANDTINAESIFLYRYLNQVDPVLEKRLSQTILDNQNPDGSWSLYYGGPGDLSTTVECYVALQIAGVTRNNSQLIKALHFILAMGGLKKIRVFTRIHLALLGLLPFKACPQMPIEFIHAPLWFPVNIYEFSSWARATIVPLLVLMHKKKAIKLDQNYLADLIGKQDLAKTNWNYQTEKGWFSLENIFIQFDRFLNITWALKKKFSAKSALKKCEEWMVDHLTHTEDIFPHIANSLMAFHALDYPKDHPIIQKGLKALRFFQRDYPQNTALPFLAFKKENQNLHALDDPSKTNNLKTYQQCCVSGVWDTAWAICGLISAKPELKTNPQILKAGQWLLDRQITDFYGDWAKKNRELKPGGWAFEFINQHYPDVDDTMAVMTALKDLELDGKQAAFAKGFDWLLGMQSSNGGFAAFDTDNQREIVNRIPFSDHGACLDIPTSDLTGRMIEFLALFGHTENFAPLKHAIRFVLRNQQPNGSWWGRWGINYIYGTWCVVRGLHALKNKEYQPQINKALDWLVSIQKPDGGFGEDASSYLHQHFVPLEKSSISQTAWALLALICGGTHYQTHAEKAYEFLVSQQNKDGGWDEPYFTGTGFPGHFYIRYHGYRFYFPLLALAEYKTVFLD